MKIAFTGKGGSGKTTIASLFARTAAADGLNVLALDADINQHLASAIGYEGSLRSMGTDKAEIVRYLRGTNAHIPLGAFHKSTPPMRGSHLLHIDTADWFIRSFAQQYQGMFIAGAGEIPEGNVGIRCYHGLNGAVELVLGHLIDRQDDVVLVDMTAGADAFSSGLFTKVDALIVVVEPTLKSIGVYHQFKDHAAEYGIPIVVVANKMQDDTDMEFIRKHMPDTKISQSIGISEYIRRRERGDLSAELDAATVTRLRELRTELLRDPIDWEKREELAERMHRRAVDMPLIDPGFKIRDYAL